jgi:hypothetical protein
MNYSRETLSIPDAYRFAFKAVWRHFGFFALAWLFGVLGYLFTIMALVAVIMFIAMKFSSLTQTHLQIVALVPSILGGFIVFQWFLLRIARGALNAYDLRPVSWETTKITIQMTLRACITHIMVHVIVVLGLFLFFIPGIYIAIIYSFWLIVMVDLNLGIGDSLRESKNITKGNRLWLALFYLLTIFIAWIPFIGLPTALVAQAYVYRKLRARSSLIPQ